tara:strand:+ start:969 stop:1499 length:531 start_codon:yes stop_codon:yes gene_type:complete
MKKIIIVLVSFLVLVMSSTFAAASPWEWIDGVEITLATGYQQPWNITCEPEYTATTKTYRLGEKCIYKAEMFLNGTGDFDEKAAFYYSRNGWTFLRDYEENPQIVHCKTDITLNPPGFVTYSCIFEADRRIHNGKTLRASINYDPGTSSSCGNDWTPTPDLDWCGDVSDLNLEVEE